MREVDFLPEWYKSGTRKLGNYHTVYVAVVCVFLLVVTSSFFTERAVSRAKADLKEIQSVCPVGCEPPREYTNLKNELARLQKQAGVLERLDCKIIVSRVIGELSFLIDDRVALSKVWLQAEPFDDALGGLSGPAGRVRAAGNLGLKRSPLQGEVRFRLVISGLAAEATDVARLARNLEQSPYFWEVIPGVSGNKQLQGCPVNEFEISCYIANYVEQNW
jgi:hypothetical protein